jgi:hypothetical protein
MEDGQVFCSRRDSGRKFSRLIEFQPSGLCRSESVFTGCELVLHGTVHAEADDQEEDVVEFDLEEEVEQGQSKALAMTRFFSWKKFNTRGMFEEMRVAWGLHNLKPVQVLGDNMFLIEFVSN